MTTIDLWRRYPSHKDSMQHGGAPDRTKAFNGKKRDPTMPDPEPSQHFDTKTKQLHDMLDRAVKDLARHQPKPASEYEGTLWRSPLEPRSRSPAYSEISDSFESPGKIEHCINNLLSTPMSPTSTQFKGPDGWPLGIEVAMNDFRNGRLSTLVLQEKELPNPLILRKKKQQRPYFGGNGNREEQETVSCEGTPSEQHDNGQNQQDSVDLRPLSFQKQQGSVFLPQHRGRQDRLESASIEHLASPQQSYARTQQQDKYQHRQECVDPKLSELQQQSDEGTDSDVVCIPTLSARKYGDDQNSLVNASSELHPALAHGKLPIGLGLEHAGLELSNTQFHGEEHNEPRTEIDPACLSNKDSPQTVLSHPPPLNKDTHTDPHQAQPNINALTDAFDDKIDSLKVLGAFESTEGEHIDRDLGCQNTFEDSGNNKLHGIGPLTFEGSNADTGNDSVCWKTSGLLEDIPEESEDTITSTSPPDQGQPQHLTPESAASLHLRKSSGVGERRDSMPARQRVSTEPSTLSLNPPRVVPTLKLMIDASRKSQNESTNPSNHRPTDAKSCELIPSAATMSELKDPARKKGVLSAAALAELRKVAESQPHFQTEAYSSKDQSQAGVHPLLRSKSFSRPFLQPSKTANDSPLKYVFEDDDSECHEAEEEDGSNYQITVKRDLVPQTEAQDAESFVTQIAMKEHTIEDAVSKHVCSEDDAEDHEVEYVGTFTPQRSTLRSSNDTTLVPSLEHATPSSSILASTSPSTGSRLSASAVGSPNAMQSTISKTSISPSTTGYCSNSAIGSPAAYNSWASTPHHHEHRNAYSTPSSAATLPTSTVPTPNTLSHCGSPTSHEMAMTPSSSFGQLAGNAINSRGTPMTPSSSFTNFTSNRTYRNSVSMSSMFARYQKSRYPDLPTAVMTESMLSSKESAGRDQVTEASNDPFTSTRDNNTPFALNLKAPSKDDSTEALSLGVDLFNTPTKHTLGGFSLHRRSLSVSGRPNTKEGIERALSSMVFSPHRSRLHKRSHSTSTSIDTTAKADGSISGHRRSLSIAPMTVEQKWETAPPPTPLALRDDFSMRYRPEPLEAEDHYSPRKDAALQGVKQGWKKVFSRK